MKIRYTPEKEKKIQNVFSVFYETFSVLQENIPDDENVKQKLRDLIEASGNFAGAMREYHAKFDAQPDNNIKAFRPVGKN